MRLGCSWLSPSWPVSTVASWRRRVISSLRRTRLRWALAVFPRSWCTSRAAGARDRRLRFGARRLHYGMLRARPASRPRRTALGRAQGRSRPAVGGRWIGQAPRACARWRPLVLLAAAPRRARAAAPRGLPGAGVPQALAEGNWRPTPVRHSPLPPEPRRAAARRSTDPRPGRRQAGAQRPAPATPRPHGRRALRRAGAQQREHLRDRGLAHLRRAGEDHEPKPREHVARALVRARWPEHPCQRLRTLDIHRRPRPSLA
jgi:hypothetical protein